MVRDRGLWSPRDERCSKSQYQADFYFCGWMSGVEQGQQRGHQVPQDWRAERKGTIKNFLCATKGCTDLLWWKSRGWKDFDKACERWTQGSENTLDGCEYMTRYLVSVLHQKWNYCKRRKIFFFFFNMGSIILGKYFLGDKSNVWSFLKQGLIKHFCRWVFKRWKEILKIKIQFKWQSKLSFTSSQESFVFHQKEGELWKILYSLCH